MRQWKPPAEQILIFSSDRDRTLDEQIYSNSSGEEIDGLMGKRNYLIEGVPGAGETAVCIELQRRGYQAIHGDRELAFRGDPETGLPTAPETGTPTAEWMSEHHILNVEKVHDFVANHDQSVTFFCGDSRNLVTWCLFLTATWTP
jgi:hypothetical protein